ncbi:MAG: sigma-70 family RNA polymerase sigma factor [Verrucomicrobia bacterium]|nr:MAG: sigma-70 family RNA polymerase sigma factor [Verrucomicrobiota bacterium]
MSPTELEALYDAHADAVHAFVLNLSRDESDAADALQEVFHEIARRPAMLNDVRDPRGFLLRLAHNRAIDAMRRRDARSRAHEALAAESVELFAATPDPDEAAWRREIAAALGELPPDQRAVVHLKLWEGLTFDKIAEVLAIPPNTAASRYRYGLDKMRERLRPLFEERQ